jgi:hypothetical protein
LDKGPADEFLLALGEVIEEMVVISHFLAEEPPPTEGPFSFPVRCFLCPMKDNSMDCILSSTK